MLVPAWLRLSQSSVNSLHVALRPYIPVRVKLGTQALHRCVDAIQFCP
jgi:hypothetical protein